MAEAGALGDVGAQKGSHCSRRRAGTPSFRLSSQRPLEPKTPTLGPPWVPCSHYKGKKKKKTKAGRLKAKKTEGRKGEKEESGEDEGNRGTGHQSPSETALGCGFPSSLGTEGLPCSLEPAPVSRLCP